MVTVQRIFLFAFFLLFVQGANTTVFAVGQTFYFLTVKVGSQNTGQPAPLIGSDDNYLQTLEETHGTQKADRMVTSAGIAFDFYEVDGSLATGFGLDILYYTKEYQFDDNSKVILDTQGALYGFSTFYRGDFWFPYLTIGSGSYNVHIKEELSATTSTIATTASFNDSARNVLFYEFGSRFPINESGVLFSYRYISAQVKIQTIGKHLELGGQTLFLGYYLSF